MAIITGTVENDSILLAGVSGGVSGGVPTIGADSIFGLGGNDTIEGGGGSDLLRGDSADTVLYVYSTLNNQKKFYSYSIQSSTFDEITGADDLTEDFSVSRDGQSIVYRNMGADLSVHPKTA